MDALPAVPVGEARRTLLRNALVLSESGGYQRKDVLLEKGRIAVVRDHPSDLATNSETEVVDCTDRLLTTGFVNAHTHSTEHWVRGLIRPLPLELWVQQLIRHVPCGSEGWHGADSFTSTPSRALAISALMCGVESLLSGCTGVLDHVFVRGIEDVEEVVAAYRALGIRAFIAPMLNDDAEMYSNYIPLATDAAERNRRGCCGGMAEGGRFRERLGPRDSELTKKMLDLWEEAARRFHNPDGGIHIVVGPVTVYNASTELLRGAAQLRSKYGLAGHTHLLETRAQALMARQVLPSGSAVKHLMDTGFLQLPGTSLAHSVWLDDEEIDAVAKCGATIVHNPLSNVRLGSGIAPLRRYREKGVKIAYGCDGSASSDGQDMLEALKLASMLQNITTPEYRDWEDPKRVLREASENGYAAVGMQSEGGMLEEGRVADLSLWDLTALSLLPRTDPANLLVLGSRTQAPSAGSALAESFVRGRRVVRKGEPCGVDLARLRAMVISVQEKYRSPAVTDPSTDPGTAASEREYRAAVGLDERLAEPPAKLRRYEEGRVVYPADL
eukprot:Hpha_TRINITY_DN16394_c1_g8::TRINITY_DN16394_c1_g8_i1::g.58927::m.58927